MYKKLIGVLREYAEWAHANEWECPIALQDHLEEAADTIEKLQADFEYVDDLCYDKDIEIDELEVELQQVKQERDAAVNELIEHADDDCSNCLHSPYEKNKYPCSCCWNGENYWEWRGLQEG